MAGFRRLRGVTSLRSLVARKRKRIKYADYSAAQPLAAPKALVGTKQKDKI